MNQGDDFFQTYPFHLHDFTSHEHPGYRLGSLQDGGAQIHDVRCLRVTPDCNPCRACKDVFTRVHPVYSRYHQSSAGEGIPIGTLNHQQLVNRYKQARRTLAKEDLKVYTLLIVSDCCLQSLTQALTLKRKYETATRRLAIYNEFRDLIAENQIPGLHRLVSASRKEGLGMEAVCKRIREALAGEYHPKNFSQYEWNFAILMDELGGKGAAHALHHSPYALPARSSIIPVRKTYPPFGK